MKIKKNIVNLGLIGAGNWGINYIKTINSLPNINLKLVYTNNLNVKNLIKSGCSITKDINIFFNIKEFDGIIIAAPPSAQFDLAMKFIKIGMPLLLEKPLSTSIEEADLILKSSLEFRAPILVNNIFIYSEAFKVFKKISENETHLSQFNSFDGNKGPYRKYMNSYWDWGPHSLSLCLSIMGIPVSGDLKKIENCEELGCNYEINLKFKNGSVATLFFGNAMEKKIRSFEVKLFKNKGILVFDDLADKKVYKKIDNNNVEYFKYNVKKPLTSVLNKFSKNIVNNNYDSQSLDLNRAIVYILETLYLNKRAKFCFSNINNK